MELARRRGALLGFVTLSLAVVLLGQAATDRLQPRGTGTAETTIVGRTGFAYLTGVRTYLAAVLWTRLDPINDSFYQGASLKDKKFLIPTIRIVTWLDPSFEQAYYVASLILLDNGRPSDAEGIALEGIRNNPGSGWMHANYAEILVFEKKYREAAAQSDIAVAGKWADPNVEFDMLVDAIIAYDKIGQHEKANAVRRTRTQLYDKYGKSNNWPAPGSD